MIPRHITLLAGLALTLAGSVRAVESSTTAPDTAIGLRTEAVSLWPERVQFGPPFESDPEFSAQARSLRERVEVFTRTHSGDDLNVDWFIAAEDAFIYCAISEWNDWERAEAGLRSWWQLLEQARPSEAQYPANLALRLASTTLQGWARVEPERALAILQETERRFYESANAEAQEQWKWWVARFGEMFVRAARKVPEPRRAGFLKATRALMDDYANNETLPLAHRTLSVTSRARLLYSSGLPTEAAALLDAWEKQHGAKIRTPDFFAVRFYVAYLGQGDTETARDMLRRASNLVKEGAFSAKDGNFLGMTDAYYAKLPLTDIELKRRAFVFMADRNAQFAPVTLTTPKP